MNNYEEMRIESDVFATARENFDLLMQRLFKSMEKNNSDEGSITLKVDLQMSQDWVPDGKGGSIEINKPVIKHKVSIAVPVKDSMDGKKDAGMNLVWDEELKRYVLKYINEGGQQSLFDPDYEENLKAWADLDESTMLPGPSNALPEDNGVIDAEFKEVNQSEEAENQADTPADEKLPIRRKQTLLEAIRKLQTARMTTEIMSMKIQRRVCRNEKRESTGQFLAVSKVRSADHIRENEIRKEHASQPELRKLPERWW